MNDNATLNQQDIQADANELLKVTALFYLKDALVKEEYETCKELLELAKKFGAGQSEIKEVLAEVFKGLNAARPNEANRRTRLFTP